MNEVRRYVPRILRDDGMIEAQEVAHYTHLNLSQYVLASDYAALSARVQAVEREAKWKYCAECGCNEYRELVDGERVCMSCGQSWFADVQYHTAVRANLSSLRQQLAEAQGAKNQCVIELYQKLDKLDDTYNTLFAASHVQADELARVTAQLTQADQQVARLLGHFESLDRLIAAHKIQDLDAHGIIAKALREAGAVKGAVPTV